MKVCHAERVKHNTAKVTIVTLSVVKPLGSLPVVQRSSDCHASRERVNHSTLIAVRHQRRISLPQRDPSLDFRRNVFHGPTRSG